MGMLPVAGGGGTHVIERQPVCQGAWGTGAGGGSQDGTCDREMASVPGCMGDRRRHSGGSQDGASPAGLLRPQSEPEIFFLRTGSH